MCVYAAMNKADLTQLMGQLTVRTQLQETIDGVPVGPMNLQVMDYQRADERDWHVAEQKERASLKSHSVYDGRPHQREEAVPPTRK